MRQLLYVCELHQCYKVYYVYKGPDKAHFSAEKYWYFPYFSTKTYDVGTH